MKKILLFLVSLILFTGCYTTFYPPANMDMSAAEDIPDSTRQVIVNNYYETTEYYQVPSYHRYSLLWDGYYWDPFYYDYGYHNWRPYYWYGHYYYYNPHNHYWYYYDHYYPRYTGGSTGGSSENGNGERVHKPGYNVLMTPGGSNSLPFVSENSNNGGRVTKPVKKVGVDINPNINDDDGYYSTSKPRIQSVGKKPVSNDRTTTYGKSTGNKKKSTTTYQPKKTRSSSSSSTHSSSSSSKSSKSSKTSSTSNKNSRNESSSSSSKKSK